MIEERRSGSDLEAAVELAGLFRLTPPRALSSSRRSIAQHRTGRKG